MTPTRSKENIKVTVECFQAGEILKRRDGFKVHESAACQVLEIETGERGHAANGINKSVADKTPAFDAVRAS